MKSQLHEKGKGKKADIGEKRTSTGMSIYSFRNCKLGERTWPGIRGPGAAKGNRMKLCGSREEGCV